VLGAIDRFMNEVEFDLQLLALLDLLAVGFKGCQHVLCLHLNGFFGGITLRRRHLGADRAQLLHDLVVMRHRAFVGHFGHRHGFVADFLDTKALTLNRHLTPPTGILPSRVLADVF
jgi:hypothetical protein